MSFTPSDLGGGKDMAGLNGVTLPFKCLLCDGEPLSLMRTKEKARSPILPLWLLGGGGGNEVGGVIVFPMKPHPTSANSGEREVLAEAVLPGPWVFKCESARLSAPLGSEYRLILRRSASVTLSAKWR